MKLAIFVVLLGVLVRQSTAAVYALNYESQYSYEEFDDAEATFGRKLSDGVVLRGMLVYANPPHGCSKLDPPPNNTDNQVGKWFVLIPRNHITRNCSFEEKIRFGQSAGYDAVIVHNVGSNSLVPMSAKNGTGIYIPSVFVSEISGERLKLRTTAEYFIVITGEINPNIQTQLLIPFAIVVGICFIVMIVFMIIKFIKDRRRQRRHRLPTSTLNKIPTCKYQKGDQYDTCAICLDDFIEGEKLRVLPCNHLYHTKCIDPWLTKNRRVCPICKRKVFAHDEVPHDSSSDSEADDTTPLVRGGPRSQGTQGGTFTTRPSRDRLRRIIRSVSQQTNTAGHTVTASSDQHSINGDYEDDSSDDSRDYYSSTVNEVLVHSDDISVPIDTADDDHTDHHDHHVSV